MSSSGHSSTSRETFPQHVGPMAVQTSMHQARTDQRIQYAPRARSAEERWRSNSLGSHDQDRTTRDTPARPSSCAPALRSSNAVAAIVAEPSGTPAGRCKNAELSGRVQYNECPCCRCSNASRSIYVTGLALAHTTRKRARELVSVRFEPYGTIDGLWLHGRWRGVLHGARIRFRLESSAVAAVQAANGTGGSLMLPPLGRLRVSFPYYSRFCGAAGEPSPGCSVPAEPSSMASNGGPDSSQGNKKRTETTVAPPAVVRVKPKETNRRLPSAWLTGSIAEQHASQEGTTTSRSPSEMLSNIGTVVPAQDNDDAEEQSEGGLGSQTVVRRPEKAGLRLPSSWVNKDLGREGESSGQVTDDTGKPKKGPLTTNPGSTTAEKAGKEPRPRKFVEERKPKDPEDKDHTEAESRSVRPLTTPLVLPKPRGAGTSHCQSSSAQQQLPQSLSRTKLNSDLTLTPAPEEPPSADAIPQPPPEATETPSRPPPQSNKSQRQRERKMAAKQRRRALRADRSGPQSQPPAEPPRVVAVPQSGQDTAQSLNTLRRVFPEQTRGSVGDSGVIHHLHGPPPPVVSNPTPPPYRAACGPASHPSSSTAAPVQHQEASTERRLPRLRPSPPAVAEAWSRGYSAARYSQQDARSDGGYRLPLASTAPPPPNYAQHSFASGSHNDYDHPAQSTHDDRSLSVPSPVCFEDEFSAGGSDTRYGPRSTSGPDSSPRLPSPAYAADASSIGGSNNGYGPASQRSVPGSSFRAPSSDYAVWGSSTGGSNRMFTPPSSRGAPPSYRSGPPSYQHRTGPPSYHSGPGSSLQVPSPGYAGYGSPAGVYYNGYGSSSRSMSVHAPSSAYNVSPNSGSQYLCHNPWQTDIQDFAEVAYDSLVDESLAYGHSADRWDSDYLGPSQLGDRNGFSRQPSSTYAVYGSSSGGLESMDIAPPQPSDNGQMLGLPSPTHATCGSTSGRSDGPSLRRAQSGDRPLQVPSPAYATHGSSTGGWDSQYSPAPEPSDNGQSFGGYSPAPATYGSSTGHSDNEHVGDDDMSTYAVRGSPPPAIRYTRRS